MKIIAETPRLILREFELSDANNLFNLDSNPNVLTFLPFKPIVNIDESRVQVKRIRQEYTDYRAGRLAVILKETSAFLGWSGLKYHPERLNNKQGFYELGYRFSEEYWGKGYATETAIASLEYGFNTLNLQEIHSFTLATHLVSQKVLKKVGFQFVNNFETVGEPHSWFTKKI